MIKLIKLSKWKLQTMIPLLVGFVVLCTNHAFAITASNTMNSGVDLLNSEQQLTITGTIVSSDDGMGLPGVAVVVKGTTTGTVTDFDGNYSINVPSSDAILVVSYLGFLKQEIAVGSKTVINVSLEPDTTALDEVVVVGYGTAKKETLTGSVEQVKAEAFEDLAVGSPALALQGRTPGRCCYPYFI